MWVELRGNKLSITKILIRAWISSCSFFSSGRAWLCRTAAKYCKKKTNKKTQSGDKVILDIDAWWSHIDDEISMMIC